jgi:hypothetical protein
VIDPLCNRKKVRGWKRRIRDVDRWAAHQCARDLAARVEAGGYAYAKLWIDPWYRLTQRIPPLWLRQRMVEALVRVHDAWTARLAASGEPVVSRLWIANPAFLESQVLAGVGDGAEWLRRSAPTAPQRPFPSEWFARVPAAVREFEWTCEADVDVIDVAEDLTSRAEEDRLVARGARRETQDGRGDVLVLRVGDLWIGTRRTGAC